MTFDPQQFMVEFFSGLVERDRDRVERMVHPDFTSDLRQSGERSRGFAAFWSEFVSYPGAPPVPAVPQIRLLGENERWAMSPGYTVVPLASPNEYTTVLRTQYPDGSWWHVVGLVEIRDGMLYHLENYFAPELPAPLAESIAAYRPG
jgi:hypothetical protein